MDDARERAQTFEISDFLYQVQAKTTKGNGMTF
jgi:hypothetical protein